MILLDTIRASPEAARELYDLVNPARAVDGLPPLPVALWFEDACDGDHPGSLVCKSVGGARIGRVTFYPKPWKTGRGTKMPAGWEVWADVRAVYVDGRRTPETDFYARFARDRNEGIAVVTAALVREGWTVHPWGSR